MDQAQHLAMKYKSAYIASKKLQVYKRQLVDYMQANGIKSIPLPEGETVNFNTYKDKEGITQRLLRDLLRHYYPDIDAEKFINRVSSAQTHRMVKTVILK
jgi:hypothetical protein